MKPNLVIKLLMPCRIGSTGPNGGRFVFARAAAFRKYLKGKDADTRTLHSSFYTHTHTHTHTTHTHKHTYIHEVSITDHVFKTIKYASVKKFVQRLSPQFHTPRSSSKGIISSI